MKSATSMGQKKVKVRISIFWGGAGGGDPVALAFVRNSGNVFFLNFSLQIHGQMNIHTSVVRQKTYDC